MSAIRIQQLYKEYDGTAVVDGVDLKIAPGEFFGLLGPNGAGKTTTLRMLLGLTPIDGGRVEVLGLPMPEGERAVRERLGIVSQFDTLDPDFTVIENMRTYAAYFGLAGPAVEARIHRLLEQVNLNAKRGARIDALSGGMKRRLTLAPCADQRTRGGGAGRAHHRSRSAGPASPVAPAPDAARLRSHPGADHPLHGGG